MDDARNPDRLTPEEQQLWGSLGRVVLRLPRVLDDGMLRSTGLTMTEYAVLDVLRDAPDRTLRMSDLAASTGLSISRVSRVAAALETRNLCRRQRNPADGRGALAVLTDSGLQQVTTATTQHARLARAHVLDKITPGTLPLLTDTLTAIADGPQTG